MNQDTAVEQKQVPAVCPLLTIGAGTPSLCLKDRCAWWAGNRRCAVLTLERVDELVAKEV